MRIALAGSGRLTAVLFERMLSSSHELVAVIQNGRNTRGAGRFLKTRAANLAGGRYSMLRLARKNGLPICWIDRMTQDELAPLARLAPDLVFVAGFGIILKAPLLRLPKIGCVNMHSSLLPKHRGPNPFTAVVAAGEEESGVTFHGMDEGIDTGNILAQFRFPLGPRPTVHAVYQSACDAAAQNVLQVLDDIARDGLCGAPQNEAEASYDKKLAPDDVWIQWDHAAEAIDRLIRAANPTPLPRFLHRGRTIRVLQANFDPTPADAAPGTVLGASPYPTVATGRGSLAIHLAYTGTPLPWTWPAPWHRLRAGEMLGTRESAGGAGPANVLQQPQP